MPTRREFLKRTTQLGTALALPLHAPVGAADSSEGVEVNDVQSQLNATRVHRIVQPTSVDAIQAALRDAQREGRAVSVAGGRHAMGGQQFGRDTLLLDTKRFNRIVNFDRTKGHIEVQGGIEWPELIAYLEREQAGRPDQWAIREKQTGVDRVSLAGFSGVQHSRSWPAFPADRRGCGVLCPPRCGRQTPHVQSPGERGTFLVGHRGLWPLRDHRAGDLAPGSPHQGPARGGSDRGEGPPPLGRKTSPAGLPLWRLPVFDRPPDRCGVAQGRVLLL